MSANPFTTHKTDDLDRNTATYASYRELARFVLPAALSQMADNYEEYSVIPTISTRLANRYRRIARAYRDELASRTQAEGSA